MSVLFKIVDFMLILTSGSGSGCIVDAVLKSIYSVNFTNDMHGDGEKLRHTLSEGCHKVTPGRPLRPQMTPG